MSATRVSAKKSVFIILITAVIAILAGTAFGISYAKNAYRTAENDPQQSSPSQNESSVYSLSDNGYSGSSAQALLTNPLLSDKVKNVTREVQNSVVVIITKSKEEVTGFMGQSYVQEYSALGSGVIFKEDAEKMYILTNAHVVADATEGYLYYDMENTVPVYLVGESSADDLAVIYCFKSEIPDVMKQNMKVAVLGDSDALKVGDLAIAIGSPYSQNLAHTTTVGIITQLSSEFAIGEVNYGIQTDASLNPGNSGGALINEKGEVIGINSAGIRSGDVKGMGFAIPINKAKQIIEKAFSGEKDEKADMGLASTMYLSERDAGRYKLAQGQYVYAVEPEGAAAKAGIMTGDVIVSINGKLIQSSTDLETLVAACEPGETIEVEISRGRNAQSTIKVSLTLDGKSTITTRIPYEPVPETEESEENEEENEEN